MVVRSETVNETLLVCDLAEEMKTFLHYANAINEILEKIEQEKGFVGDTYFVLPSRNQ